MYLFMHFGLREVADELIVTLLAYVTWIMFHIIRLQWDVSKCGLRKSNVQISPYCESYVVWFGNHMFGINGIISQEKTISRNLSNQETQFFIIDPSIGKVS